VLRVQGRTAEAQACCEAALAVEPRSAGATSLLAELHADRGSFAEAHRLFQQAIALDPDSPTAYCGIAQQRRMTADDTAWRAGVEALLARPLPLGHQVSLRYALGKYSDDTGQYDAAFDNYRQANELSKRFGVRYDRSKLSKRVAGIVATFDAGFVAQSHAGASASERPVFIVGMPRSGTTLVEQILASHPKVHGAGELNTLNDVVLTVRGPDGNTLPYPEFMPSLDPPALKQIGARYVALLHELAAKDGQVGERISDKMPSNYYFVGLIHLALPNARIIHTVRDPVDTCISCFSKLFTAEQNHTYDLGELGRYYRRYERLMAHWRRVLPKGRMLEVRYEDVVADLDGQARRIIEYCGLPWDDRCLAFHETDRPVRTASATQVRQPIYNSAVGRWKVYEEFLGPLLKELQA